jgi:hypothetical protein
MRARWTPAAWSLFLIATLAAPAAGQQPVSSVVPSAPAPGVRAAGMGGAFTAVADDASAVFWNPAGLASGAFFSLVLDRNGGGGASTSLLALSTPPLGLSYYRTATGHGPGDQPSLVAHHAGVTLVQSLGGRLAVGGTLKIVHGVVSPGDGGNAPVATSKFDVDLGLLATGSLGRIGLTVHNLTEPAFAGPGGAVVLPRRVRAGIAVNTGTISVVSADADLSGEDREAAVGVETHPARKAWLRGGVHWTTAGGSSSPIGSVGASYAVYGSTVADAQVSFGSDKARRGWGVGLRFVF